MVEPWPFLMRMGGVCAIVVAGCNAHPGGADGAVARAQAVRKVHKPGSPCPNGATDDDESEELDDELTDPADLEDPVPGNTVAVPAPATPARPAHAP